MTEKQLELYDSLMGKAPPWVAAKIKSGLPPSKQESKDLNAFLGAARQVSNSTAPFITEGDPENPKIQKAFEELQTIFQMLPKEVQENVGFCLDTQHMFASGYDIVNNLEGVVKQMEDILGMGNIIAVHFNDSKTEFASNKDRHEDLGKGLIGELGMKGFLNHPKLKHLDFILETPSLDDEQGSKDQVGILKSWAE
jgi:endonuclease IV